MRQIRPAEETGVVAFSEPSYVSVELLVSQIKSERVLVLMLIPLDGVAGSNTLGAIPNHVFVPGLAKFVGLDPIISRPVGYLVGSKQVENKKQERVQKFADALAEILASKPRGSMSTGDASTALRANMPGFKAALGKMTFTQFTQLPREFETQMGAS